VPRGCNKESCMTLELLIGAFGNQFAKNYLLPSFFRPSVCTCACLTSWEQRDCHRTNFLKVSCFELLLNFVKKFRFAFKVLTKTEYRRMFVRFALITRCSLWGTVVSRGSWGWSCRRPSGSLDDGFVWTLKNYSESTCRTLIVENSSEDYSWRSQQLSWRKVIKMSPVT
jgi:hypothetical protein